jgi:hypothetical protein
MEASPIKKRSLRTRLFAALIGACGFGMELTRALYHFRHPGPDDSLFLNFMLGFIFLAMAVLNSIPLVSRMQDLQDIAKK